MHQWGNEELVKLDIFVLENIFERPPGAVLRDEGDAMVLQVGPYQTTHIVLLHLSQLPGEKSPLLIWNINLQKNFKLDVDRRRDDDASPTSSWRVKVQWCKLIAMKMCM